MMNFGPYGGGYNWGMMGGGNALALNYFLCLLTWLLIIAVLIALLRILWKKGNGK